MAQRLLQDMWRPVYEQWGAVGWTAATLAVLTARIPYRPYVALACVAFAIVRGIQAFQMYHFRVSISGQRLSFVRPETMLDKTSAALGRHKGLWLGRGFGWTQQHAQLARNVLDRNPHDVPTLPEWLPRFVRKLILPKDAILDPHAVVGASWIHGLGNPERDLYLPLSALPGHTLIVGTTRSGKTRLYELLTFQAVHSGGTVIVMDPKGDKDWEKRLRAECERCEREFLFFHLAFPSQSIRINPLATWNNASEIASRVSQLLAGEAGGDGFVDFADSTISRIVSGEIMVQRRPTLKSIKHYVEHGVEELLEECFQKWFVPREGADWDKALAAHMQKAGSRLKAMVAYYTEYSKLKGVSSEAIGGLITIFNYDREWFGRVIVRLVPLLQRLAAGELGSLLSPDVTDVRDQRPIYTMDRILSGGKVLYVGADMLSNKMVGSAVISMLLADMAAAAGSLYNFGGKENVYLFMDEAAEGINEQAIQIQNKAGMAGFKVFIATQTCADLEVRLGSRAKAMQVLGNTNNVICLRLRDPDTAKMVADLMGETMLRKINVSHSSGAHTETAAVQFSGNVTRKVMEERAPLVGMDLLMRLPNLQYFAMVAGGHIVKGRLPIIT